MGKSPTRRTFLKAGAAAVSAPYVITSTALGSEDRPPASDRIVMGGIGVIALAGIVVNNNIVLIDTYNDLKRSGL